MRRNTSSNHYPLIRLWCQFGCIEQCFPLHHHRMHVTQKQIDTSIKDNNIYNNFNEKTWVEIPDDCLGARLDHKLINLTDYNAIVVEFLKINQNDAADYDDNERVSSLSDTPLYWPLTKSHKSSSYDNIEIGDLVDVVVEFITLYAY